MKRKKLAGLLTSMAFTALFCSSVYAADIESLTVNGVSVLDENYSFSGVSYDEATNTLTLNNCNIVENDDVSGGIIKYEGSIPLNVVILGNNTITGEAYTNDEGSVYYFSNFIWSSDFDGTSNDSIYISGNGTLNLYNIDQIVWQGVDSSTYTDRVISIDGVTINSNGGGIISYYSDIIINNSNIKLDHTADASITGGFRTGCNDAQKGITINNSTIEFLNIDSTFICSLYDFSDEYIYVGDQDLEFGLTCDNYFNFFLDYYPSNIYNHVLITNENKELKYQYRIEEEDNDTLGDILSIPNSAIEGSTVNVSVEPYPSYEFDYLLVNGQKIYDTSFVMPSQNTTVSAYFKRNTNSTPIQPTTEATSPVQETTTSQAQVTPVQETPAVTVPETQFTTQQNPAVVTPVKAPAKPKLLKLKNIKVKKVKITWKKVRGANGYEIMYATNKKFTKGKKVTFASAKASSKMVKKLKKKKTYYFRIRAYVNSDNGKVYSSWSNIKKIKIKK